MNEETGELESGRFVLRVKVGPDSDVKTVQELTNALTTTGFSLRAIMLSSNNGDVITPKNARVGAWEIQ